MYDFIDIPNPTNLKSHKDISTDKVKELIKASRIFLCNHWIFYNVDTPSAKRVKYNNCISCPPRMIDNYSDDYNELDSDLEKFVKQEIICGLYGKNLT